MKHIFTHIKLSLRPKRMRHMDKVERLISVLQSEHEYTRDCAARRLAKIGDVRAVIPLVECFVDPKRQPRSDLEGEVSWAIPNAIRAFGECAVAPLLPHLHVQGVIWMLGRSHAESAVDPLIKVFEDEAYASSRLAILHALGCIGSARALPFLRDVLKTYRHPTEIDWAKKAIGRIEGMVDRGHCH